MKISLWCDFHRSACSLPSNGKLAHRAFLVLCGRCVNWPAFSLSSVCASCRASSCFDISGAGCASIPLPNSLYAKESRGKSAAVTSSDLKHLTFVVRTYLAGNTQFVIWRWSLAGHDHNVLFSSDEVVGRRTRLWSYAFYLTSDRAAALSNLVF